MNNLTVLAEVFFPEGKTINGTVLCTSFKNNNTTVTGRSGWVFRVVNGELTFIIRTDGPNASQVTVAKPEAISIPSQLITRIAGTIINGTKAKTYVNGQLVGETPDDAGTLRYDMTKGHNTVIGIIWEKDPATLQDFLYSGFTGIIGYVRIYNRVLSADEIELAGITDYRISEGLIGEWPLDEGSGTIAYDSVGSRNGTLNNVEWATYENPVSEEIIPNYPPGSKIRLQFRAGDSDPLPMGTYYMDRMQFEVGQGSASVEARNSIGKYLKDQTFDERNVYSTMTVQTLLTQILTGAGITNYHVGPETTQLGMEFSPSQDVLSGIDDVLTTVRDWQIREEIADGKVVVAERTDEAFTQPGTYTFYRNRDVFSRSVTKDDGQTYGRVCVHSSDFSIKVYRPVSSNLGWLPPAQKTLYQQCPDGTTSIQAAALATEIAEQLSNSGEVEEFVGPIRPQLMPGDSAEIIDNDGPRLVGIITTVTHNFGKDGFYTQFTVDSGGKINKLLLSDYLKQISAGTVKSKITS